MRKAIFLGLSGLALTLGAGAQCTPPTLTVPASLSLCNGANTPALTFSSNDPNAVISWTNNSPSIGLAAAGTDNIASFRAVNSGGTNVVATISVTAGNGTCSSAPQSFTITVKPSPPTPSVSIQGNLLQSSGGSLFSWYYNGSLVDGASGASYAPLQNGSYSVQVLGSNGCASALSPAVNFVITAVSGLRAGSGLRLAQNPVRSQLQLQASGAARSYTACLLSAGGGLLWKARFTGGGSFDVSRLPAGHYLLVLRDERSGQLWQEWVVKG